MKINLTLDEVIKIVNESKAITNELLSIEIIQADIDKGHYVRECVDYKKTIASMN